MSKAKKPPALETGMLAEDAAKQAVVEKFPGLARLSEDRVLTFRFYGRLHMLEINAFDITGEDQ